ncbi:MAG: hypothetical protein M1817_001954 [Caeruleum heppii]|nr:MAG: hypothetical protein M1817_001954 [Caeruleum heppii]
MPSLRTSLKSQPQFQSLHFTTQQSLEDAVLEYGFKSSKKTRTIPPATNGRHRDTKSTTKSHAGEPTVAGPSAIQSEAQGSETSSDSITQHDAVDVDEPAQLFADLGNVPQTSRSSLEKAPKFIPRPRKSRFEKRPTDQSPKPDFQSDADIHQQLLQDNEKLRMTLDTVNVELAAVQQENDQLKDVIVGAQIDLGVQA